MSNKHYITEDGETRELDAEFFRTATRLGRPPMPEDQRKVSIKLRLDPDIVDSYRATGKGWQARINADLRKAIKA